MNRYIKKPLPVGPTVAQTAHGEWLAVNGSESEFGVGVMGASREEAITNLAAANKRWAEIAAMPERGTTEGNARESARDAGSEINPDVPDQGSVRNATEWISVKDTLPDDGILCLVCTRDRQYVSGKSAEQSPWKAWETKLVRGWYVKENKQGLCGYIEISHWMPVCALPDQKD